MEPSCNMLKVVSELCVNGIASIFFLLGIIHFAAGILRARGWWDLINISQQGKFSMDCDAT